MSYDSFKKNLSPEIYTGDHANNLRFYVLPNESHWVGTTVAEEMNTVDTDLAEFFKLHNSADDCPNADWEPNWLKKTKDSKFLNLY